MTEYWDDIDAEKKRLTHIENSKTIEKEIVNAVVHNKSTQATSLLKNIFNDVIVNSSDMNEAKFTNIEISKKHIELRWGEKESLNAVELSMLSNYREKRDSAGWIIFSIVALLSGFMVPLMFFLLIIFIPLAVKNFDPGLPDYIDENNYNFIRVDISNEYVNRSIPVDTFNSDPSIIIPIIAKKLLKPEVRKKQLIKRRDYWIDNSDEGH